MSSQLGQRLHVDRTTSPLSLFGRAGLYRRSLVQREGWLVRLLKRLEKLELGGRPR